MPFVACGDLSGFDADKSYPLELELELKEEEDRDLDGRGEGQRREGIFQRITPPQMPIRPPHETYLKRRENRC